MMVILANEFSSRGYAVDLVLVNSIGPYCSMVSDGVRVINLKQTRTLFSLPLLIRYLRSEQPVSLLSALDHANIIAWTARFLSRAQTRIVVSMRNNFSAQFATLGYNLFTKFVLKQIVKVAYKNSDQIIAISQGVANDLVRAFDIDIRKINVIYNPIDAKAIGTQISDFTQSISDFSLAKKNIFAMGRLVDQKGFSDLIKAFALVSKKFSVHLFILGEGPLLDNLKQLARSLGVLNSITFLGFVKNPFVLLKQADLFVFSSIHEGFGNALLEAMACGVPIVSTNCPSGPSEILEDGKWGSLVPVGDISALAQAMEDSLVAATHPDVATRAAHFNIARIADEYIHVLLSGHD